MIGLSVFWHKVFFIDNPSKFHSCLIKSFNRWQIFNIVFCVFRTKLKNKIWACKNYCIQTVSIVSLNYSQMIGMVKISVSLINSTLLRDSTLHILSEATFYFLYCFKFYLLVCMSKHYAQGNNRHEIFNQDKPTFTKKYIS